MSIFKKMIESFYEEMRQAGHPEPIIPPDGQSDEYYANFFDQDRPFTPVVPFGNQPIYFPGTEQLPINIPSDPPSPKNHPSNDMEIDEQADDKECEETIQLSDHSDDDSASNFANMFMKKMDEDARQKDMPYIVPCQGQKLKSKSQLLGEKQIIFDDDTKVGDSTISFSQPNSPPDPPSRNLRPRPARAKQLVDVDPLQEFMANLDPCMEDVKVYYPSRDDSDAVEVSYADMACLAPEAYISSAIMNFYIRCLQQSSSSSGTATGNFHFFTTYFCNKLEKLSYKEDSFLKFRKWWKGVNIFEKTYIFLPVHENAHWSLVIICFPNKEDEMDPVLLHLDSLELHDSMSLFNNIKRFLKEEWSYLRKSESYVNINIPNEMWENLDCRLDHKNCYGKHSYKSGFIVLHDFLIISSVFVFIYLFIYFYNSFNQVPQQKNEYDCGLFVLFYMERFIKDAPERFTKNIYQWYISSHLSLNG
ncbi:ubiquitin-like-specific protease 1D [Bidens hawaiensis]|uniref:ubiquitin-like-specific protease 1D n=1 Tax=Bidens hawaiensis TaxID=980011 RepID=UPI004049722F